MCEIGTPGATRGFFFGFVPCRTRMINDQPKITVDGKEYLIYSLSDDAKAQLDALNMTDRKLAGLQQ